MAAFSDGVDARNTMPGTTACRRRRYERSPGVRHRPLTPPKVQLLVHLSRTRVLSLFQAATLMHMSPKGTRLQTRALYEMALVDVIAVGRVALADDADANDASLLTGSSPNIYRLTDAGWQYLHAAGLIAGADRRKHLPTGPKNAIMLRHELQLSDAYCWFNAAGDASGGRLAEWSTGENAVFALGRNAPVRTVRPDAWTVFQISEQGSPPPVLVGLLEIDRGTERVAGPRWRSKLAGYTALFASDRLKAATGYHHARILVVTSDAGRRDRLAAMIAQSEHTSLRERIWIADRTVFQAADLGQSAWRLPGSALLRPLIPAALLRPEKGTPS